MRSMPRDEELFLNIKNMALDNENVRGDEDFCH